MLLGGNCYHMRTVFETDGDVTTWAKAFQGKPPDWTQFFAGYTAAVDWPASALWPQLSKIFPDAIILLSKRSSAQVWGRSMSDTVLKVRRDAPPDQQPGPDFRDMFTGAWQSAFGEASTDDAELEANYENYLARVRSTAPANRLIEWEPSQGWEPICEALGLAVPQQPFPHTNTTAEFLELTRR